MKNKQNIITLYRQGKSCRKIAETVGADKDTVYRYIAEYNKMRENYLVEHPDVDEDVEIPFYTEQPKYRLEAGRSLRVVTPEVISLLNGYIRNNETMRLIGAPKQQQRANDMHTDLKKKGYKLSYSTVKRQVSKLLAERGEGQSAEAFIRQEYKPGVFCEFDWCEIKLEIDGQIIPLQLAVFTGAYSNDRFAKLFLTQDTAAFQEAHADYFAYTKAVYNVMVYDNARVQVKKVVGAKEPTEGLLQLAMHYGFEFRFCNCRRGNEKPHVERSCDKVRHAAFTGPDNFKYGSLDEANAHLLSVCEELNAIPGPDGKTPAEKFQEEYVFIQRDIPRMECCHKDECVVDKYSTVCVFKNHYSVPDNLVGKTVISRIYTNKIEIWYKGDKVAEHMRDYLTGDWKIDIFHYIKTLKRKPGALLNSSALSQSDTQIKKIYEDYYNTDAKTFLLILEKIKDKVVTATKVLAALRRLSLVFPRDFSVDKVLEIASNITEKDIKDGVTSPDSISKQAESTLSDYDLLTQKQSNTQCGEVDHG